MKYRKKPLVVEAVQWDGFLATATGFVECEFDIKLGTYELLIPTLEGEMRADIGDWIIKGVKGEFYPCKPDVFEASYEPVE